MWNVIHQKGGHIHAQRKCTMNNNVVKKSIGK